MPSSKGREFLLLFSCFQKTLRIPNTSMIAILNTLQRQGSNECGTHTATVLSGTDLNWVLPDLLAPTEDLAQGLGTTSFEVRVLVEDGAVSANVAGFPALLLADGGNATGREAGGACAD